MNPEIRKEWVAELRAGKYHQVNGALHKGNGYRCGLGVLVDVFIKYHPGKAVWSYESGSYVLKCDNGTGKWDTYSDGGGLPEVVSKWAGLNTSNPTFTLPKEVKKGINPPSMIAANDTNKESFSRLADRVEYGTLED